MREEARQPYWAGMRRIGEYTEADEWQELHRFGTEASSGYGWNGNSKPAVAAYQPDTDFEMHYCMGRDVRN